MVAFSEKKKKEEYPCNPSMTNTPRKKQDAQRTQTHLVVTPLPPVLLPFFCFRLTKIEPIRL